MEKTTGLHLAFLRDTFYRAVALRHNRIKNERVLRKTQYPFDNKRKFEEIMVKNLGFSSFLLFFYSFSFSPS